MEEIKQRINADIPIDLYKRLKNSSLSITDTVVKGFEQALNGKDENYYINLIQSKDSVIKTKDNIIQTLNDDKGILERRNKDLQKQLSVKDNQLLKLKTQTQELNEQNKSEFVSKIFDNPTGLKLYAGTMIFFIITVVWGFLIYFNIKI